jgi:DNA-binding MarR family transcriptional regulator
MAQKRMRRSEILANELREAAGKLTRRLRAESADQAHSMSQTAVLARLHNDGPLTVSELARAEHVKPQSMGATVASLEEERLVARKPDPKDARCWKASITEHGKEVLLAGRAARQAWLARALEENLDETEQRQLLEATSLLKRVLEG